MNNEPVVVNLRSLAHELNLALEKVQPVVELLDEGFPVPFIARYRKDQTGNLGEEEIRAIHTELQSQRLLAERKQTILRSIDSLGKLTPELDQKIRDAKTAKRLEDLYLPYKPKKQTLASVAKTKGLEPLAMEILEASENAANFDQRVSDFISEDKGVKSAADALLGAGHIISEIFSEKLDLRHQVREIVQKTCVLASKKVETKSDTETADASAPLKKPRTRRNFKDKKPSEEQTETAEQSGTAEPPVESGEENPVVENTAVAETPVEEPNPQPPTPEPEPAPVEEPQSDPNEDHSGAGGGEIEEEPAAPETPAEISEQPPVEDAVPTPESSEEPQPESSGTSTLQDAGGTPTDPGAGETPAVPGSAEDVSREFQQWKDQQKEQDKPVVRSQNQLKKKKQAEKRKEKERIQQRKQDHFEKLFQDYFNFTSEVKRLPPHRVLAMNRGEKAKVLRLKFDSDNNAIAFTAKRLCVPENHPHADYLNGCAQDAIGRLVLPSMEREIRNDLTENAENHAVRVFAKNLRSLLLQPPLHRKKVLALDPGFKHGCKMVALDEFGNVLDHATVYLVGSAEKRAAAESTMVEMIQKFQIPVIAIGNGTGCRETEEFVSKMIAEHFTPKEGAEASPLEVSYVITNEAGASVYSASPLAKEEFPNYDILLRGAISIGRRLQDPLNELVKIEPVSLGVGMYQHDLKAKHLRETLNEVVESCVNFVGVDLNTATPAILRYVSGLNQLTAKRIYDYRIEHGPFKTREELKKVPGLGEVAFTHCAGFLRIPDGVNPLDATWIHPEMYDAATKILEQLGFTVDDLRNSEKVKEIAAKAKTVDCAALSGTLGIGPHTIYDILAQLSKPGRDPREELPPPIFKKGVLKMEDLKAGMELNGTILNVVDFGAFVDIGLHDSGLIHISQLADCYVKDAHDHVAVGDVVRIWVVEADPNRGRISLTMIPPGTAKQPEARERPPRRRDRGPNRSESSPEQRTEQGERRPGGGGGQRDRRDRGPGGGGGGGGDRKPESRDSQPQNSSRRERAGEPAHRDQRPPRDRDQQRPPRERGGGGGGRRDRRDGGGRYDGKPKTYQAPPKDKVVAPISEEMKKGKEPMRSFGDLAQLFGRVQANDPAEEKKRLKEEKKAKKPEPQTPKQPEAEPENTDSTQEAN